MKVRTDQEEHNFNPPQDEPQLTLAEELKLKEEQEDQGLVDFIAAMEGIGLSNVPTLSKLKNWKSKYGNIFMNNVVSPDEVFIWRVLNRLEWKQMMAEVDMSNTYLLENHILENCLLYPEYNSLYKYGAGYAKSIYSAIMYQSGFVDENFVISTIRIIE